MKDQQCYRLNTNFYIKCTGSRDAVYCSQLLKAALSWRFVVLGCTTLSIDKLLYYLFL